MWRRDVEEGMSVEKKCLIEKSVEKRCGVGKSVEERVGRRKECGLEICSRKSV